MGEGLVQPVLGLSEIVMRPVFEAAEFGEALTPELVEQEVDSASD